MNQSHIFIISVGLSALFFFSCNQSQKTTDDAASIPGSDSIRDSVLKVLVDVDEAWDHATVTADSFVSFFTDDGIWFFMDGSFRISGKEEIQTMASKFWARPHFVLDWEAMSVGVNKSYDFG